jgi:REP element-mobilizing transposase RayT
MPRGARLRLAGLPLHIIQRGNNRTPCFYADDDYGLSVGRATSPIDRQRFRSCGVDRIRVRDRIGS